MVKQESSGSRNTPMNGLRKGVPSSHLAGFHLRPNSSIAAFRSMSSRLPRYLSLILNPRHARAAVVDTDSIRLRFAARVAEVSLADVEAVDATIGCFWSSVRICHRGQSCHVSGLSRTDANALAEAIDTARCKWWRSALAVRGGMLRSVYDHIAMLADPPKYLLGDSLLDLETEARSVADEFHAGWPGALSDVPEVRMLQKILEFLKAPGTARMRANEAFVANELVRSGSFFDQLEAHPLTEEQRRAVVIDGRRNLVIAAAGSGKTSVIVAKAGWLVRKGYCRPSELLMLAFARDAREELQERIDQRLGARMMGDATVHTFHALGMVIIGEAGRRRPALTTTAENDRALFDLLKGFVTDLLADRQLSEVWCEWFQKGFAPYRSCQEFSNWSEYYDYIRQFDIRSLKGEIVRSFEECEIANFLYLNGIPYTYEAPYEHDLSTSKKRQYKPDFHLPDHNIYIEHFGINESGDTASFVDREQYQRDMDWKREVHAEHGTVLIETFSYEHTKGKLLRNLTGKLAAHGVELSPIPPGEMFNALNEQGRIDPFTRLVATFLQHFKGSRLSFADLVERAEHGHARIRAQAFLKLFRPIYARYQEMLKASGEIDFHDMINRATDLVEAGCYRSLFRYILVDEFQDISPSRARLLKALLDSSPGTQMFAVGHDWQAIYRFGGSDISVMRDFEEHFGAFERIDLATTFRCADRIATVATNFVLRNAAQLPKTVRAMRRADSPVIHIGVPGEQDLSLLKVSLDRVAEDAGRNQGRSDVLLLSRYRHRRPQHISTLARQYPGLRLSWSTIHRSKGLEADYVVVLGLCAGKYGFPAAVADDPLLDLVLAEPEAHPDAEERRLLYVAITRAGRQVFLLAEGGPPSVYVRELLDGGYDVTEFGRTPDAMIPCPHCSGGQLRRRESGVGRVFFGCSNFPLCEYTARACPKCGIGVPVKSGDAFRCRGCDAEIEACPLCGNWIEIRMGSYGRFFGCSNWPDCEYTRNLGANRARNLSPHHSDPGSQE